MASNSKPTLSFNVRQLDILRELRVDFCNLVENGFKFKNKFYEKGWFEYFTLDKLKVYDILEKEF